MKKIPTIARSALLPPSTLILQTFNTARSAQLLNSYFILPTSDIVRRDPERGGNSRDDREDGVQDRFPGFFLHSGFI